MDINMIMKLENTINDYYNAIGRFENMNDLYNLKKYKIQENDDEETIKIKKGQQRELLVDMGRIGEMCFKYIIKLEQISKFSSQSYDDFVNKPLFMLNKKSVANTYKNEHHLDELKIDSIRNFQDENNQPLHNFYYLYKIIEEFMPDSKSKFIDTISINLKSKNAEEFIDSDYKEDILKEIIFPEMDAENEDKMKPELQQIRNLIKKRNEIIETNGDIFTRLRYFENNEMNRKIYSEQDVEEIYDLINDIVLFVNMIHLNHDNLDLNVNAMFAKYKIDNYDSFNYPVPLNQIIELNKEERDKIFFHPRIKDDKENFGYFLRSISKKNFNKYMEIFNSDDVMPDPVIVWENLDLEKIRYFRSIGVTDYESMNWFLCMTSYENSVEEGMLKAIFMEQCSFDEFKKVAEKLNVKKYGAEVLCLRRGMLDDSILALENYPDILEFFISNLMHNANLWSYDFPERFYLRLLSMKEVHENLNAWYGLDNEQLLIYKTISTCINSADPSFNTEDRIMNNIRENIECFKNNRKLLSIVPLMLDNDGNQLILNILYRNGLNIENVLSFDSRILCFPVSFVELIETLFVGNDIPLVYNNELNPEYITFIENMPSFIKYLERVIGKPKINKTGYDISYIMPGRNKKFANKNSISPCIHIFNNEKSNFSQNNKRQVKELILRMKNMSNNEFIQFYHESYDRKLEKLNNNTNHNYGI